MQTIHDHIWINKFTEKEKRLLLGYAKGLDLVDAARQANYGEGVVSWVGEKLIARPEARAELRELRREMGAKEGEIPAEDLIHEFKIIAQASVTDYLDELGNFKDVIDIDPEKAKAIKEVKRTLNPRTGEITVTLTMHDKISALQNLGRMGGHYAADNGQQGGDVNIQLNLPAGLATL